jgi:hypothetical protein
MTKQLREEIVEENVIIEEVTAAELRKKFAARVTITKTVTLPLFKWIPGVEKYLTITSPIFQGKEINEGAGKKKKDPAYLMEVIDLVTGEKGQVITATVLKSTLLEEYPDDAYVGLSFCIKQRKIPGKDYNGFDIAEISVD